MHGATVAPIRLERRRLPRAVSHRTPSRSPQRSPAKCKTESRRPQCIDGDGYWGHSATVAPLPEVSKPPSPTGHDMQRRRPPRLNEVERHSLSQKDIYDGLRVRDPTSRWQPGDRVFAKITATEFSPGHIQKIVAPRVYMVVFDDATIVDEIYETDIDTDRRPGEMMGDDAEDGTPQPIDAPADESTESEMVLAAAVVTGPTAEHLSQRQPFLNATKPRELSSQVSCTSSQLYPSGDYSSSLEMPMAEILVLDMAKKQEERLRLVHDRLEEVKARLRSLSPSLLLKRQTLVKGAVVRVTSSPCFFGKLESICAEANTCEISSLVPPASDVRTTVGLHEIEVMHVAKELVAQHQELSKQVDCFFPGARVLFMQGEDGQHLQAGVIIRRRSPTECQLLLEKSKTSVDNVHIHQLIAVTSNQDHIPHAPLEPLLKVVVGAVEFTIHEQVTIQDLEAGTSMLGVITEISSLQSVIIEFDTGEVAAGVPTFCLRKYTNRHDTSRAFRASGLSAAFGLDRGPEARALDEWVIAKHPQSNLPERCRVVGVHAHSYDVQFADSVVASRMDTSLVLSTSVTAIPTKPHVFALHDHVLAMSPRLRRCCSGQVAAVTVAKPAATYTIVFDYGETYTGVPHDAVHVLENTLVLTPRKRLTNLWRSVNGLDAIEETTPSFACHGDLMLHKMLCSAKKRETNPVHVGDAILATFHESHKYFLGVVRALHNDTEDPTVDVQFASTLDVPNVPLRKVFSIGHSAPRAYDADPNATSKAAKESDLNARRLMAALFTTTSSRREGPPAPALPPPPVLTLFGRLAHRHQSVPVLAKSSHPSSKESPQPWGCQSFANTRKPSSVLPKLYFGARQPSTRRTLSAPDDEKGLRRVISGLLAPPSTTHRFPRGCHVAFVVDDTRRGTVAGHPASDRYTVVLDDADVVDDVAETDLVECAVPPSDDDPAFDADDGVEFTTWWLPRITSYLVTRPTSSTRGSKILVGERPATLSPAPVSKELVSHVEKLKAHVLSRLDGGTPPTEIAVGAHVLVRGPPAYFGCIQVVYAGGTLLDILDGQRHLHHQVSSRLVEIITIDTQLQEHCAQLTAMVENPVAMIYPWPFVTSQTQIENGRGASFTLHARVQVRDTKTAGLIVAINSNATMALELETGFTDGCVHCDELDPATEDSIEAYMNKSSISKVFHLSSTSSAHASTHESGWSSLPPLLSARCGTQSRIKTDFQAHDLVLAFSPRWQQYCVGTVLERTNAGVTVVFDYGEIYAEMPLTKVVDVLYTKVICDSRGNRLAPTWNYSHGWEGVLDTSVACKGDPLLHQMLCVPAQMQYWYSQFHIGDVVLARYWDSPQYSRGILVKIHDDLSVNIMFESGHLQRNVPCSHILSTAKEPVKVMEKPSPKPAPASTTDALPEPKRKPQPPRHHPKRTILRRITHLLGFH
ncbi:hypothetical protein SPRG_22208 [Saprolegnia parasitica CBS 223.65]|uniref:Uncharacterized protein n=1 Tax=Saprolegnia parasitica (strain CBS 223.65) TaxID=695850 RepID=A0A067CJK2_SAPPC|nr:hypothetical protein SPRG_22208 [Saprolegnia parasitica CBS 223.65]KDO26691.1 hypothetical protein SPRG_22208 [Saprolegnia parasitica CBS 223.65]|eukprot:XP_012202635.1 hypothetical protein SPRG_22208 [Saprolegnia parasitica CBS 223.65]